MAKGKAGKLIKLLDDTRPALEAALADAEWELEQLNERRDDLEQLIARVRSALTTLDGTEPAAPATNGRLTLHEAMAIVLRENAGGWGSVHELAEAINRRGLYEKRDGTRVDPSQIHARANKYPAMFEKDGPNIRLRAG